MRVIGVVIRRLIMKLVALTQRFMQGRYGTDKLNTAILLSGLAACVLSMFIRLPLLNWLLTMGSYVLMGWAIFRSLSFKFTVGRFTSWLPVIRQYSPRSLVCSYLGM